MVGELRARQIVHLHRLFYVIAEEFHEEGMSPDRLAEYEAEGVSPNDFKATKTDHEAALAKLSAATAEWAAEEMDEADEPESWLVNPIEA